MQYRTLVLAIVVCTFASASSSLASSPDSTALKVIAATLFGASEREVVLYVDKSATIDAQEAGSLIRSIEERDWAKPIASQVEHVTFFEPNELATLAKTFPNQMWANVAKNQGSHRAVLVRFLLERSSNIGAKPAGTRGMMVLIVDDKGKIIHLSTDDSPVTRGEPSVERERAITPVLKS
ncbi:hypothetical protein [Novipirellula caenicola]|uniref:Uncharacterized protein n=1 Tax=Novipirellula caenicola TaxID=1536901 RepID=A0ABP9W2Z6_9BACT